MSPIEMTETAGAVGPVWEDSGRNAVPKDSPVSLARYLELLGLGRAAIATRPKWARSTKHWHP